MYRFINDTEPVGRLVRPTGSVLAIDGMIKTQSIRCDGHYFRSPIY